MIVGNGTLQTVGDAFEASGTDLDFGDLVENHLGSQRVPGDTESLADESEPMERTAEEPAGGDEFEAQIPGVTPEDGAEADDDGDGSPGEPDWVKQRLGKMAAQKNALREENEKLQAEIEQMRNAQGAKPKPEANERPGVHPELRELTGKVDELRGKLTGVRSLQRLHDRDPDQVAEKLRGMGIGEEHLETPEMTRRWLDDAQDHFQDELSDVRGELKFREAKLADDVRQVDGLLARHMKSAFPWVADENSPQFAVAGDLQARLGWLDLKQAGAKFMLAAAADAIHRAQAGGAKAPAVSAQPAPQRTNGVRPPGSTGATAPAPRPANRFADSLSSIDTIGDDEGLTKALRHFSFG